MRRRFLALVVAPLLLAALSGCGYSLAGRGSALPTHIKNLIVMRSEMILEFSYSHLLDAGRIKPGLLPPLNATIKIALYIFNADAREPHARFLYLFGTGNQYRSG